jgi:hypothetical protein
VSEPTVSLAPGTVTVHTLRSAQEETACYSQAAALAWAAATAQRYPGAEQITIRVHAEPWRDAVSSGINWVARVTAEWSERHSEPGPRPRDLEDLLGELARIDNERYEEAGA